jgi:hypothetical protein
MEQEASCYVQMENGEEVDRCISQLFVVTVVSRMGCFLCSCKILTLIKNKRKIMGGSHCSIILWQFKNNYVNLIYFV